MHHQADIIKLPFCALCSLDMSALSDVTVSVEASLALLEEALLPRLAEEARNPHCTSARCVLLAVLCASLARLVEALLPRLVDQARLWLSANACMTAA